PVNTPGAAPAPYAPQPNPTPAAYAPPALAATAVAPLLCCQMGHEVPPGGSYCVQGHPALLDVMQYARQAYLAPGQPPQPQGYAPPPQQAYASPPQPQGYGPAQQQGYEPAQQQGYAPPQGAQGFVQPAMPVAPSAPPPQPRPADVPQASPPASPPDVLRGFLVAYGINPAGDFWPLKGGRHILGRLSVGEGIDISAPDPTVSSRHGALVVDAASGSILIEDTGSMNGTFVNDEHIGQNGRRELRDGDRLRLGGFTMIVKVIGQR
ncbi:MAG: FHA domain-containing protein, partial [Polyangiaceae bacterium]